MEKGNSDFVIIESHRKYFIRCNPVQLSSSEKRSLDVEEMNKKSVLCELERQKENLMACKETKSSVRRKRKYTARKGRNENTILQQDKQAKVYKTKKNIQVENTKQHQQRRKNLDERTKKSIQDKDTKQHQERRKNLDETTKKNIKAENTKQHQERRKNLDKTIKKSIQDEDTKQHHKRRKSLDEATKKNIKAENAKQQQKRTKNTKMEREKVFEEIQGISMVDPSILDTEAYHIIEDERPKKTTDGPEYYCDICLQCCYKSNVLKLKILKYDQEILDRCYNENHGYIQKKSDV